MLFTYAKCGGAVDEFHEYAMESARVNECDLAREAVTGLFIDQFDVFGLQIGQGSMDIVNLKTDVMESFATLLKETSDPEIRADRLQHVNRESSSQRDRRGSSFSKETEYARV